MEKQALQKLAQIGDTDAQYKLGVTCLKLGINTWGELNPQTTPDENEYAEGIAWLEQAANAGNLDAQEALGAIYQCISVKTAGGWNIRKTDKEKSRHWNTVAAERSSRKATWRLAQDYAEAGDTEKAIYWYNRGEIYYPLAEYLDEQYRYKEANRYYALAFDNDQVDVEGDIESYLGQCDAFIDHADFRVQCGGLINSDDGNVHIDLSKWADALREALEYYQTAMERYDIAEIYVPRIAILNLSRKIKRVEDKLQTCQDKTGIQTFPEDEWQQVLAYLLGTDTPERQATLLVLGNGAMNVYRQSQEKLEQHLAILPIDNEQQDLGGIRTHDVILLCCLGGGHTRLIPPIVERLQAEGKQLYSVCALPMDDEGTKRTQLAQNTLRFLSEHGIRGKIFHNQYIMEAYADAPLSEGMEKANQLLADYVLELTEKYGNNTLTL